MKSLAPCLAIVGLALLAAPALALQAQTARVSLTFDTGAETGAVMVALYDSAQSYGADISVRQGRIDVAAGARSIVFDRLPAGDYAVKAFPDVDGDGRMNVNPFGIPTEPYAFSNNAVGNMGPASWDRARFTVSGDAAQTLSIR